jgi:hypothetical protein
VGTFELGTVTECSVAMTVGGGREGTGGGAHFPVTVQVGARYGDEDRQNKCGWMGQVVNRLRTVSYRTVFGILRPVCRTTRIYDRLTVTVRSPMDRSSLASHVVALRLRLRLQHSVLHMSPILQEVSDDLEGPELPQPHVVLAV